MLDPVGSTVPQLPKNERLLDFDIRSGETYALPCNAQAAPAPNYRLVILLFLFKWFFLVPSTAEYSIQYITLKFISSNK